MIFLQSVSSEMFTKCFFPRQAQEGVEKRQFRSLEDLVDYYSHRGRGLVCPLARPIAQSNEDEELPDSGDSHVTIM